MSEKEMNSYRFGYNVEPTDEMLAQIMKEVAEEARESSKRVHNEMFEKMRQNAIAKQTKWEEEFKKTS